MWTLGYIVTLAVVIWVLFAGAFMTFIGSQFQKELLWVGLVFLVLGGLGSYKLVNLVNVTVNVVAN